MFLFPWMDWGNDISDFEKIDFLAGQAILSVFSPSTDVIFYIWDLRSIPLRLVQKKFVKTNFLETYRKQYDLSSKYLEFT